jgi:uncharacterized protein
MMHVDQQSIGAEASNFNWLLNTFVDSTSGVSSAVAVSSDGLLMAMSRSVERATAEQLSAIIAGLASLGHSTARCFAMGGLDQVIIAMDGGFLFVSSVSDGSCLGVVADRGCDVGSVGYQMGLLVERAGTALSPALVAALKETVLG